MNSLHRRLCLILLCTTQFIALLDFSITMIPLPQIQQELLFTVGGLQWVVNAYGVTIAGFLLLGGRAADIFGRRHIFLMGIITFTLASLIGGFSVSPLMLIITRAFQGVGAALFSPAALSLLLAVFTQEKERNKALGVWTAVAASGFVVGLILGGIITDLLGWRWVLWINVPVGGLVILFSSVLPIGEPEKQRISGELDIIGALLVSTGFATLIYAFANSENVGIAHPITCGLIILSLLILSLFIWVESKVKTPLVPIALFLHRSTGGANVASLLANTALGPTFVVVALYMQMVLGFSATEAGLGLLPMAIAFTISSAWIGPILVNTIGTKLVIIAGMLVFTVGLVTLGLSLSGDLSWASSILPGTLIAGVGYGVGFPAWTVAGLDHVEPVNHGLAGGMLTMTQELGSAIGLAVGVAIGVSVLVNGGTAAQGFSYAILMSACLVLIGIAACLIILPNKEKI